MKTVVFLDIDGVLNGHEYCPNGNRTLGQAMIQQRCVYPLNRLFKEIEQAFGAAPDIYISSIWRVLIHCGDMTIRGFQTMLESHGMIVNVVGVTSHVQLKSRDDEILDVVRTLKAQGPLRWIAIDDLKLPQIPIEHKWTTDNQFGFDIQHVFPALDRLRNQAV